MEVVPFSALVAGAAIMLSAGEPKRLRRCFGTEAGEGIELTGAQRSDPLSQRTAPNPPEPRNV